MKGIATIPKAWDIDLSGYPNFHVSGSVSGMRKIYGDNCLLVRQGKYIYNVESDPIWRLLLN